MIVVRQWEYYVSCFPFREILSFFLLLFSLVTQFCVSNDIVPNFHVYLLIGSQS